MTRNIGQKFCLFDDLKGETPSVLKEKEMFSGLSLLSLQETRLHEFTVLLSTEYITDVITGKEIILKLIS